MTPERTDDDWWDGPFPPGRRREGGGIRARSRRGAFATTWWGRRFVDAMEAVGGEGRVARGRTYARAGQVLSLDVGAGAVRAPVQGSRVTPYEVTLGFGTWDAVSRGEVAAALAEDPAALAGVLAGTMPEGFEVLCSRAGLDLFPASGSDARFGCTCPDIGDPCKHAAAVVYLLAEWLDDHPFGVLTLRGVDRDLLLADVSTRRRDAQHDHQHGDQHGDQHDVEDAGGSAAVTGPALVGGVEALSLEGWTGTSAQFAAPGAALPPLDLGATVPALTALDGAALGEDAASVITALAPAYEAMRGAGPRLPRRPSPGRRPVPGAEQDGGPSG